MYKLISPIVPVVLLSALTASSPVMAAGFYTAAPPRDIDSCVALVRESADFAEASRVRHDVTSKRRTVGFVIEIDTTVYGSGSGAVLREYESVCIATGGKSPSRFRIEAAR